MNKLFVGLVVTLVAAVLGVSAFIFKDGTVRVADGVPTDAGVVTAEGEGEGEGEAAPAVTPVTTPTSDTVETDQSVMPTPTVEAGEPTVH